MSKDLFPHEVRLTDTNSLVGWIDLDEDIRHHDSIVFPFIGHGPGFSQLKLSFVTVEPNRYLLIDTKHVPILQQVGCFRPNTLEQEECQ